MAFTLDPQTGKISFGVVSDGTHDAISLDLASQFGVSEDFKDNFTDPVADFFDNFSGNDNWDDQGTRIAVNTTTDVIDWDTDRDTTVQKTVQDLGVGMVSDTNWVLRWKLDIANLTTPTGANRVIYMGIGDQNQTVGSTSSLNEALSAEAIITTGGASIFRIRTVNNSGFSGGTQTTFTLTPSVSTFYMELKRTSSTRGELNIYSDATFTTLQESQEVVMATSSDAYRYIFFQNADDQTTTGGTLDGTIDDVEFYNGVTPLLWSPGVTGRTEITGGALEFTFENGGDDTIAYDLGTGNVSDTSWVFRTKLVLDTSQNPNASSTHGVIMMSDSIGEVGVAQDAIGFKMIRNASSQFSFRVFANDGATDTPLVPTDETVLTTNPVAGTYYIELKRTSASAITVNIFSDSEYTALLETESLTITGSITGLRYVSVANRDSASQTTPAYIGRFDDMQLWNVKTDPTISSLNWRARFKLDITNLDDGANATDKQLYIGLSDVDALSGSNDTQDGYLFLLTHDNALSTFNVRTPDGQAPRIASDDATFGTALPAVDTFYVELLRDSASQTTTSIYSDATFATLTESEVSAGVSGSDNLKYLKLFNDEVSNGAGAIDGTFDDFTFTDLGVASLTMSEAFTVDAILTGVIDETFTIDALIQALGDNGCSNFFDDFSGLDAWDDQGTKINVNTTTDVIDFDASMGGTIEATALDLGAGGVPDNEWTLRFKFDVTATAFTTQNVSLEIGIFDSDETTSAGASQDFIAIEYNVQNTTGLRRYVSRAKDGGTTFGGAANWATSLSAPPTTHYVEVKRDSPTSVTLSVYSDAGFSSLIGSNTFAIPSTITGLRYIKVQSNDTLSTGGTLTGTVDNVDLVRPCPSFTVDAILAQRETFDVDAVLAGIAEFTVDGLPFILPVESFLIDSCIGITNEFNFTIDAIPATGEIDKTFTIDGIPFNPTARLFVVDALVETFGPERSNVGDLIIRVLQENPPSQTGTEIVEKAVIITTITDPTAFNFTGKTSRIKNWLGFLERNGIVQDDGSSPDWYRTNWSLV